MDVLAPIGRLRVRSRDVGDSETVSGRTSKTSPAARVDGSTPGLHRLLRRDIRIHCLRPCDVHFLSGEFLSPSSDVVLIICVVIANAVYRCDGVCLLLYRTFRH